MADFDIGESLPTEDSQLHAVMTSQRDINSIKTVGGEDVHSSEDGEKSVAENNDEERKPAVHRTLENGTNTSSSTDRAEMSEKSIKNIDELNTKQQSTVETPKLDSLEPGDQEKVLDNNVEKKENSANGMHQTEHSQSPAESNISSKNIQENSTSDHESGSHRSPNRESKAEYRKIKSEVTGEAETSESEGEEKDTKTSDQTEDTWMDILGNGLLQKRVLREGKGQDTRPDKGQRVMIQSAGRTEDGTAVDWNSNLEFILGEGEVIQAFDIGISLMELDEVCELVTDARYAYGKAGKPDAKPPIPPDAKITYEIQLLSVRDGPNINTMSDKERISTGEKKREMGNDLYTGGDYAGAINSYQRAIKYLGSSTSEEVQSLRVKCWNNMAAAQLKIKAYSAAEKSCSQVLQVDPDNVKALFRKGKVLASSGDTDQALGFIKKADQLDPSNPTIKKELNRLKQLLASEKESERSMYRRMVGDLTRRGSKKNNRSFLGWQLVFGATVVALGGILMAIYLTKH